MRWAISLEMPMNFTIVFAAPSRLALKYLRPFNVARRKRATASGFLDGTRILSPRRRKGQDQGEEEDRAARVRLHLRYLFAADFVITPQAIRSPEFPAGSVA